MLKNKPKPLTQEQIKKLQAMFKENGVFFAYLFGSVADKDVPVGHLSDYDFGIYFDNEQEDKSTFGRQVEMMGKIADILKFEHVDVIELNRADPIISHKAVFKGKNIYSFDEDKRADFEHRVVQNYEDFRPLNQMANKMLREFVLDGTIGKPMFYQKVDFQT